MGSMSNVTFGAVITVIALAILCLVIFILFGPGHNVFIEGVNDIYGVMNASRVGLGL